VSVNQPRRGRRAGSPSTRELILASARTLFAEKGFEGTSLREIARDAGVDPAMVHHYFTGKEDLFSSCVELPANPDQVLAAVSAVVPADRGPALLRTLLVLWDSPAQPALLAMLRSAVGSKAQAALLREVLFRRVLARAMAGLGTDADDVRLRGSLLASQIMGLMMARYLVRLEPLASASHDEIVAVMGPTIQHYLTGSLRDGFAAGS
jgi:AcrR family transcriptional regulator